MKANKINWTELNVKNAKSSEKNSQQCPEITVCLWGITLEN